MRNSQSPKFNILSKRLILFACAIVCVVLGVWINRSLQDRATSQIVGQMPKESEIMDFYRVKPCLRSVIALQRIGQARACRILKTYASKEDSYNEGRVIVLCRLLFKQAVGGEFRRPGLGQSFYLCSSTASDWPLEPLGIVDDVPFNVVTYEIFGASETPDGYLEYCMTNCVWNDYRYKMVSDQEIAAAFAKLMVSQHWNKTLSERDEMQITGIKNEFE